MTIAFWCVLVAGLLPYAAIMIAKAERTFDNRNPRTWLANRKGFRARAHAAHLNSFEGFPLFAAGVIIAHLKNGPGETADMLALGYVIARLLFLGFYIGDQPSLRSVAWFAGLGCAVSLFFLG
jgi:uncharacterized MAPEG superfamily protein